ncbi:helix-hairpin-helix domain-containing protein [Bacillus sp. D386]|uniref:helix-hairpin-helix domain-containing protein n=1 Tax=Bacillus sp. D386 TaxID=2587155 RepID=UPI001122C81E|nr:helix-hairpin-helix domain-containing protein [Bacillus sp. D386]
MNEKIVQFIRRNGILLAGAGVACTALFFWNMQSEDGQIEQSEINWTEESAIEKKNEDTEKLVAEPEVSATYKVDVKGAVQKPGVYEFLKGDRVTDVIQKAGGLKNGADSKQVNMAQLVEDEMVIYIPIKGETAEASNHTAGESSGNTVSAAKGDGTINLNKATSEELQELPGIGPSKATAILQKREELGSFKTIEDLKEVTGIGDKTFEKLRELITVK